MKNNIAKVILTILLISCTLNIFSQYATGYKNKGVEEFYKTKTMAVLIGDIMYDGNLKLAMEESWKQTPYDFINVDELDKYITDAQYSFILPLTFVVLKNDQHQLALIIGGKKSISSYTLIHMVSFAPVDGMNLEKEFTDCAYRLPHMIKSLHDALSIVKEQQINVGSKEKLNEYYCTKTGQVKSKTLLINKEYIGATLKEADIKEMYPYPYELSSTDSIEKHIDKKTADYCYWVKVSSRETFNFIIDIATGDVIYAESESNKLSNKEKFKFMVDAIAKE